MKTNPAAEQGRTRRIEVAADGFPMPRWRGRLQRFCDLALREAGAADWDLSLLFCDDRRMSELNGRYRGKEGPTDVLSFPQNASRRARKLPSTDVSGEIAISLDTMRRNARAYEASDDEELKRLLVHGILHLAGMDHGPGRGGAMFSLQRRLLARLENERIIET